MIDKLIFLLLFLAGWALAELLRPKPSPLVRYTQVVGPISSTVEALTPMQLVDALDAIDRRLRSPSVPDGEASDLRDKALAFMAALYGNADQLAATVAHWRSNNPTYAGLALYDAIITAEEA